MSNKKRYKDNFFCPSIEKKGFPFFHLKFHQYKSGQLTLHVGNQNAIKREYSIIYFSTKIMQKYRVRERERVDYTRVE